MTGPQCVHGHYDSSGESLLHLWILLGEARQAADPLRITQVRIKALEPGRWDVASCGRSSACSQSSDAFSAATAEAGAIRRTAPNGTTGKVVSKLAL